MFNAFLRYIYGSHIRLIPPPKSSTVSNRHEVDDVESTPDTSFASIDENDLTEEYDKYSSNIESDIDGNEVSILY